MVHKNPFSENLVSMNDSIKYLRLVVIDHNDSGILAEIIEYVGSKY